MKATRRLGAVSALCATSLLFAACSGVPSAGDASNGEDTGTTNTNTTGEDTGFAANGATINGSGATSQTNAQQAWRDNFTKDTGVVVNYDGTGSGTGREQFIAGEVLYAGSDSAMSAEEITDATARCSDQAPVELPLYISPIAIAFNIEGIDSLNLTGALIAKIFDGKVTKWNDPAIAAINEGVELPDLDIVPVNRADDSGTTKNFQQYLIDAAGADWPYEAGETWPKDGTQSAEKTSGVVQLVTSTPGAVTYADASQIGDLGTAAVEVSGEFVAYSPEAAAKIVDGSQPSADATDRILAVDLKRDGSIAGAYPIVMVSYLIACTAYDNADDATNVKNFLTYVASEEGQQAATAAQGGNAPISEDLRTKVMNAINMIGA